VIFSYISQTRAKSRLDKIHINLDGGGYTLPPIKVKLLAFEEDFLFIVKGCLYFMIFINDYSRYRWFFLIK